MWLTSRIGFLAAAATWTLTCAAGADTEQEAEIDDLRAEVAELRTEVQRLREATGEDWLTEQRAEEIKMLVQDVLADADTRASLMQDGVNAGYKSGFFIQSADGNYKLRIRGQIQVRYVYNYRNGSGASAATPPPNNVYGFEVRRAKVKFDGHVFDPTWKYVINIAADHDDRKFNPSAGAVTFSKQGDVFLEDAIIKKNFENGLELWAGQFKLPFLQEELVSSTSQQAVERSLVNEEFNQDRSKALMLVYTGDAWKFQGAFSDGFGSLNTPYNFLPIAPPTSTTSSAFKTGTALAFTVRADWLAMGNWSQFKDFTSPRGSELALKVGGAVHYERGKYNAWVMPVAGFGNSQFITWTVDGSLEGDGWNVYAYFVGRHKETTGLGWSNDYGAVVQGGYYLTDDIEAYARYEWGQVAGAASDLNAISVGANYYINKHSLKWTTDVGVGLNQVVSTFASGGANWLTDASGRSGQVVTRSQLQLLF